MSRIVCAGAAAALAALIVAGCQPSPPTPGPVGIANPASVYCGQAGYTLEIREDEDGAQFGVCVFPDGTECEEWAFFQGECGQDKTACAQQGHTVEVRDGAMTCVFADGSSCPEFDFAQGNCGPGTRAP